MNKLLHCLALLLLLCGQAAAEQIAPFESDGCSAFPDGTLAKNELWLSCCVAHDYAYWMGGTYEERQQADEALRHCVAAVGEPAVAALMQAGVRAGGSPFLPTTFRWGYGWPSIRGYRALSVDDMEQIRKRSNGFQPEQP